MSNDTSVRNIALRVMISTNDPRGELSSSTFQQKTLNTEPLAPYKSFLEDELAFQAAVQYLLTIEIATLRDEQGEVGAEHKNLAKRVSPTYNDPYGYFMSRLFITHVAAFEVFLRETVAAVIQRYPKKAGAVEFRLADILDTSNVSELVERATEDILNRIMYKKPHEYLQEVCELLSIDRSVLEPNWRLLVEAKARRDLGVHNAWKCNVTYLRKVAETGIASSCSIGDSLVPQEESYLNAVFDALSALANSITRQVLTKHWPEHANRVSEIC